MTLKNNWVQGIVGLVSLGVLAMAGQWWISQEVKSQLANVSIPDTGQLTTDVEVMKADTAIANQQRFEEIFTEYLINEANR